NRWRWRPRSTTAPSPICTCPRRSSAAWRVRDSPPAAAGPSCRGGKRGGNWNFLLRSEGVGRIADDWIRPATGGRPEAGVAPRLGQPSMADSPPQRIHALLSATPAPERPPPVTGVASKKCPPKHRSTRRSEPCPGDRGSRKAKHGCFARESGQDALTERKATPGRQGAASVRSRTWRFLAIASSPPRLEETQKKGSSRITGEGG